MASADLIAALVALLRAETPVTDLTSTRIWGGAVPRTETSSMPGPAVVLRYSGGTDLGGYVPVARGRVDVWNYGRTPREADSLRRVVAPVLKNLKRGDVHGVLVSGADLETGPFADIDPEMNWHFVMDSWRVLFAE